LPAGYTREAVLKIEDLQVFFISKRLLEKPIVVKAVDRVSFDVGKGEVVALVGESGSGKTTLARAAIGLTPMTSGRVILYDGGKEIDVGKSRGGQWKALRRRLQMIFQDPFSSVDPNMRVFDSLRIPLQSQGVRKREEIDRIIHDVLKRVGLPDELLTQYIFQLSGGQRQRIGIARVLLFDPALIIADEPVSMLDASLKGDILHIFEKEATERGTSFIFITHEMAVARVVAARIAVMYLGKIVEIGPAERVIDKPLHPYTQALLQASPHIDTTLKDVTVKINVKGELALSTEHPPGCKFHPRCPYIMETCKTNEPSLKEMEPGHWAACWLY
jgi:oligopeptide/dipeptide ABC transporter ATP-binding protein